METGYLDLKNCWKNDFTITGLKEINVGSSKISSGYKSEKKGLEQRQWLSDIIATFLMPLEEI